MENKRFRVIPEEPWPWPRLLHLGKTGSPFPQIHPIAICQLPTKEPLDKSPAPLLALKGLRGPVHLPSTAPCDEISAMPSKCTVHRPWSLPERRISWPTLTCENIFIYVCILLIWRGDREREREIDRERDISHVLVLVLI